MSWSFDRESIYHASCNPDHFPIQIVPLGGLGEIGLNAMLVGCQGRWLLIDCGSMFPPRLNFGIDLILPNLTTFSWFAEFVDAVIITHGHEDHVGALPYLLRNHRLPVFGPTLANGLLIERFKELGVHGTFALTDVSASMTVEFETMSVTFVNAAHSIPDALSLIIHTPFGDIVHTGDYRLDPSLDSPIDVLSELQQKLTARPILLLGDSTNILVDRAAISESTVAETIRQLLSERDGRVYVALFSSNLGRICDVIESSNACGRRVAICGKRIRRAIKLGTSAKLVTVARRTLIDVAALDNPEYQRATIIVTGTQAEGNSELVRIAHKRHRHLEIRPGDTVIFSSREIPGNERNISDLKDLLCAQGADIIDTRNLPVHCSGHACRPDIRKMLRTLEPERVIPIHGTRRFLRSHAELARDVGAPDVFEAANGDVIGFSANEPLQRIGQVDASPLLMSGKRLGTRAHFLMDERRSLSYCGVLVVSFSIFADDELHIALSSCGFLPDGHSLLTRGAEHLSAKMLANGLQFEHHEIKKVARIAIRRYFNRELGKKPIVHTILEDRRNGR